MLRRKSSLAVKHSSIVLCRIVLLSGVHGQVEIRDQVKMKSQGTDEHEFILLIAFIDFLFFLGDKCRGSSRDILPGGGKRLALLVVTGKSVDARFNKNELRNQEHHDK